MLQDIKEAKREQVQNGREKKIEFRNKNGKTKDVFNYLNVGSRKVSSVYIQNGGLTLKSEIEGLVGKLIQN